MLWVFLSICVICAAVVDITKSLYGDKRSKDD